jgi:hypothetical protein
MFISNAVFGDSPGPFKIQYVNDYNEEWIEKLIKNVFFGIDLRLIKVAQ